MKDQIYALGIDIGSTTVKIVILDPDGKVVFSDYRRHFAHIQETLAELIHDAEGLIGDDVILVNLPSGNFPMG